MFFQNAQQRTAGALGVPQPELRAHLRRYAALLQIAARLRAAWSGKLLAKGFLRQLLDLKHGGPQVRFGIGILRALGHRNAVAFGQQLKRFRKTDVLEFHYELQHVAGCAAAKALVKLMRGMHRKRRGLLAVEWAEPRIPGNT